MMVDQPKRNKAVNDAVANIPQPADGKSLTPDDVRPMLEQMVKEAVSHIPVPRVHGGFITVNLRAGAAVTDGIVAVVVDDGFVAVDQNTDGIRIGNRHTAFVIHFGAVAGDINTVTAAADVQCTVLIHHRVITCDFGTCRALTINGGVTVIVHGGFITVNLCAGAAVADGVVAVIVDDGFITVDQNTDGIRIGNRHTRLLYQSTHVSVASSTSARFFQLLRCITSAL